MRLPWGWILGLPALALLPVLAGTFNYDDVVTVLRHPGAMGAGLINRPLFRASLALDYLLWGLNPAGYHLTSLLLHLANVALLATLAGALARMGGLARPGRVALAAGLLFGLHPLAASAACYVSERSALLVAASALLVFHALVRGRPGWATTAWLAGCLSKESAAAIPFCSLALLPLIPAGPGRAAARRWALGACLAAALFGGWILWRHLEQPLPEDRPGRTAYALTELRAVWTYLRLWILPFHQALDADIGLSSGWLGPATTLLGALGLLVLGLALFKTGRWLRAGVLVALIALLPESSFAVLQDPRQDYRMYLPSAALALAAAPFLSGGRRLLAVLAAAGLLLTAAQARAWTSEAGIWQWNLRVAPRKLRVHSNLAQRYRRQAGHFRGPLLWAAAERTIGRAIRIRERPEQHRDLAVIAYERGDQAKAMEALARALLLEPGRPDCLALRELFLARPRLGALYSAP